MSYAIENVQDVLGKCYVSTDSEEYGRIAEEYGAIVLERPERLSGDYTRLIEVLQYHGEGYDGVLCQPPTAPFVTPGTLLRLIRSPCAVTVSEAREHPCLMVGAEPVYPRQKRGKALYLNGCASFRGKDVLKECDFASNALWNPHLVEIKAPESINIDDEWDFRVAKWNIGNSTFSTSTTGIGTGSSINISAISSAG